MFPCGDFCWASFLSTKLHEYSQIHGGLNPLKWRFYKMGDFGAAIDPANFNQ